MQIECELEVHATDDFYVIIPTDEWLGTRTEYDDDDEIVTMLADRIDRENAERSRYNRVREDDILRDILRELEEMDDYTVSYGLYGESHDFDSASVWTGNHDNAFSKDFAFTLFAVNGQDYAFVDGTVYLDDADDASNWFDWNRYEIVCDRCGSGWHVDESGDIEGHYHNRLDGSVQYDSGYYSRNREYPPSFVWSDYDGEMFHNCAGTVVWFDSDNESRVYDGGKLSAYAF